MVSQIMALRYGSAPSLPHNHFEKIGLEDIFPDEVSLYGHRLVGVIQHLVRAQKDDPNRTVAMIE